MQLITTFPSALRYECDINACKGCCSLFEEIEVSEEEVQKLEGLGYSSFHKGKDGRLLLKNPCPFSKGKLCDVHLRHGYSPKPEACKKYPFTVSVVDNGWVMVDVKWACGGVGTDKGVLLTPEFVEEELLSNLDLSRTPRVKLDNLVPLSDESESGIPRSTVRELYDIASRRIIFPIHKEKISYLTSFMTRLSKACKSKTLADEVSESLRSLSLEPLEPGAGLLEHGLDYYGLIDGLLGFELNPLLAGKKLGLDYKLGTPTEAGCSKVAEELYSLYLSQCLMETLSKPWSLRASFFWALGVMGFVDFVSMAMAKRKVGKGEMRAAIAVVDFLNKGFEEFRDYAYPRYPELGLSYLGFLLGERD